MMDTTQVSSNSLKQTSIHSNDGLLIQKDGAIRYFGGFKANLKHGWGVLYTENYRIVTLQQSEVVDYLLAKSPYQIHTHTGHFLKGKKHGRFELQVIRHNDEASLNGNQEYGQNGNQEEGSTIIEMFEQIYVKGKIKQQNLVSQKYVSCMRTTTK